MAPLGERDQGSAIEPPVAAASERLAAGDAEAALALLAPLVERGSPSVAAQFVLAHIAWHLGRLDWALELARACHELAPMDGAVAETLASLHAQSGDLVESVYFGKLATALGSTGDLAPFMPKRFPTFDRAFHAIREKPQLQKAQAEAAAGKLADALESARQHAALDSDDAAGRGFYAALLRRAGRSCEAVAELQRIEQTTRTSAPLALLYAESLTAAGDAEAAKTWHEVAATLLPDDPGIAAARVADGLWLDEPSRLSALGAQWTARFTGPAKRRRWPVPAAQLVIAYIVPALLDRRDAAAIAAVAGAHERSRTKVIAYASGAQSWLENSALSGGFDKWQDLGGLDPATVARYFDHDGVNVVIDASGFASPATLLALAETGSALRVSWLGNPAGITAPVYDARIVARHGNAREDEWGIGLYPLVGARHIVTAPTRAVLQFGSDASLAQLDPATMSCWAAILRALPEARLLLRDPESGAGTVDRLIARFGRDLAARIDLVAAARFEEFYARVDVALAPRRGSSPRMAAEAIACGVPVVVFQGTCVAEPYGSFLAAIGVGPGSVASDEGEYVRHALALAKTQLRSPAPSGAADPASFAAAIEEHAMHMLRQCPCP
jgi:protein O-GlcNAc transferase